MMCSLLLSWALVLSACGPGRTHPISESAEMSYSDPVTVEEGRPEDLSLADQAYLSRGGINLAYPSLLAGEVLGRDGLGSEGFLPREAMKEALLEKQSRLAPFARFLGQRRQYRKRGTECFWKYCV